jgi:hypothetical protein
MSRGRKTVVLEEARREEDSRENCGRAGSDRPRAPRDRAQVAFSGARREHSQSFPLPFAGREMRIFDDCSHSARAT